jgi:hypothetical protein
VSAATAASTTPAVAARIPIGGSCSASTRRATGTANSGTRLAAIAAIRAIRLAAGRPATRTRTHKPMANTASMAAVRDVAAYPAERAMK